LANRATNLPPPNLGALNQGGGIIIGNDVDVTVPITNIVWNQWNVTYAASTTITTYDTWSAWNSEIITASTSSSIIQPTATATGTSITIGTSSIVWGEWNDQYIVAGEMSQAALRELEAQRAVHETRYRAEAVERDRAKARAERLLREALTPKQAEELQSKGHFHLEVFSKTGGSRIYRINRGRSRNVQQVDASGKVVKHLCAHPTMAVPDADTMLAQKLWLEHAEEEFLRVANHS
jgi:hypothetical protein